MHWQRQSVYYDLLHLIVALKLLTQFQFNFWPLFEKINYQKHELDVKLTEQPIIYIVYSPDVPHKLQLFPLFSHSLMALQQWIGQCHKYSEFVITPSSLFWNGEMVPNSLHSSWDKNALIFTQQLLWYTSSLCNMWLWTNGIMSWHSYTTVTSWLVTFDVKKSKVNLKTDL